MFNSIVNFFRDIQINSDYPKYEKQCQIEHEKQAERRFSSVQLRKEVRAFNEQIEKESNEIFKNKITKIRTEISHLNSQIFCNEKKLSYFIRNYKKELDDLYNKKKSLFSEKDEIYKQMDEPRERLSDAFDRKNEAYEKLNDCNDNIDSWHAQSKRTPGLLGNGGNKIPNHSIFWQSHGDLKSFKDDRDEAYNDIQDCKDKIREIKNNIDLKNKCIAGIKREIDKSFQDIKKTKVDRAHMYSIKKEGNSEGKLKHNLKQLSSLLHVERNKLNVEKLSENEFTTMKKHQYGVIDLEEKIKSITQKKDSFIKEYFLEKNKLNRINTHRMLWLKERNLT